MSEEMIRKHFIFYGQVQGVGFRYFAVHKSRLLGLAGWVQNIYDGSVEMEVQGREEHIKQLIQFLEEQRFIMIEKMDVEKMELKEEGEFRERGGYY